MSDILSDAQGLLIERFRKAAVIVLLVLTPIIQIGVTRLLPMALGVCILLLLIGHGFAKSGQLNRENFGIWLTPSRWGKWKVLLFYFYAAFVLWSAASMFWSLAPQKGYRQLGTLVLLAPIAAFLVHEFAQVDRNFFARALRWGISISAIFLISELLGFTEFHRMESRNNHLFDLNRNAVLLSLIIWTLPLFWTSVRNNAIYDAIPLTLTVAVQYLSHSQAAQLSFVIGASVGLLITCWRHFKHIVFASMIASVLAFPFIISPLANAVSAMKTPILESSHAMHRVSIWNFYTDRIAERPVVGWGIRSDRVLGQQDIESERQFGEKTTHTHNSMIEIWTTLGFVGAALVVAILFCLWQLVARMQFRQGLVACQLSAGAFAYASTGSSLMQGWWIATILVTIVLFCTASYIRQPNLEQSQPSTS